jgi:hypothetical protein
MKTTRALLSALVTLLALGAAALALTNLSLPVTALFEYSAGTLVTAGLLTMLLTDVGTPKRGLRPPSAPHRRPRAAHSRPAARHTIVHA